MVVDAEPGEIGTGEAFRVLRPAELGIPDDEWHRMATIYDVTEFSTALKPFVLRHLLAEEPGPIVYLDPDIEVHAPFGEVAGLALRHGIVLTPHVLRPMPRDGYTPTEANILISGIYNLGFIAVGPTAAPFLDWWGERLRRDAVIDPRRGLFTDQRWIDFVPVLFDHHIVRSPAYNVAYWNIFQRSLTIGAGGYEVDGEPLRFYHFSGFDHRSPETLSKHAGKRPRTSLDGSPVLARLCRNYAGRLLAAGHHDACMAPYGLGTFPNGLRLDTRERQVLRAVIDDPPGEGAPPDPFTPGGPDRLLHWLRTPDATGDGTGVASRYLAAFWNERPDVRSAFPELSGPTGGRFLEWAAHDPALDAEVGHPSLRTTAGSAPEKSARHVTAPPPASVDVLAPGVTVAGYFTAELGVGQAARLLLAGIEEAGIPFSTVTYERTPSSQAHPFRSHGEAQRFDVNIICVNADQTPIFARDMGERFMRGPYNIGLWFWEVEVLPPSMHGAFDHVDEVWVASEFVAETLRPLTAKPVHVVPLPALVPSHPTHVTRQDLDLPDAFLFLSSFDFYSVVGRKNPVDLIDAFAKEFAPGEAALVLKTINGSDVEGSLEALRKHASCHPDIHVLDGYLPAATMRALTGLADCVVSLHRSEGLGLSLLEAMALAKPVIATGYSGNLAFMDDENSFLVGYDLVPVGGGNEPYPAHARWAQPRVDDAARLMRLVVDNRQAGVARGLAARRAVSERNTPARTAAFIESRLRDIRARGAALVP